MAKTDWQEYYEATLSRPPNPMLLKALENFGTFRGFAVDLGCGAGRDSLELLEYGWRVLATDKEAGGIDFLLRRAPPNQKDRLQTQVVAFEDITTIPDANLITASYSIPFCHPDHFDALWSKIVHAIKPGGRFAGQLFGDHDSWTSNPNMTFHSAEQVQHMLDGFEVEFFEEIERDGTTACAGDKHWHLYSIVFRKPE